MYPLWKISEGEMLEWLKRHAWKACKLQKGFRGSNPRLSAKILRRAREVSLLTDTDRGKSFEQGASGSLWGLRRNPRGERRAVEVSLLTDTDRGKSFEQGASGSLWGLRRNPQGER